MTGDARTRRANRAVAVLGMALVWILLWGTFSWANLLGGLVVAGIVLLVFPLPPVVFAGRLRPVPLARFVAWFLRDLFVASVQIAWLAFRFGYTPHGAIIGVGLRVGTDLNLTLTAEALSLVPGSLIVEVDRAEGVLWIHVLDVRDRAEAERFRQDVLALESRIVAAVGSPDEVRRTTEGGVL
ncbi:Na+/H+ antiporter subunit E [Asanoa iriomotensis]|uniref:Na+/H+ antiporter subunit E n=1 Tax=Asanoa iriomotensis TaxID=234613 RepID=A0ABQ4CD63_9ACTN|nr:Na+/H+ antiporter subunit E [Asanoa iriomotensis]GIF60705.1 Na+/H+ antiporter subunit E [Asanoa iriomotensis]